MDNSTVRGREIIGIKGFHKVVYRIVGRKIFMYGKPTPQYYNLLSNFKQKDALKRADTVGDWCCLELVESINIDDLYGKFVDTMKLTLEKAGYKVTVSDLLNK